ncbi:MAG TPA: nucleotidyltransferase domain-containing protein [Anaerolineae bacterium]|nr:nucleotidyltransferase domain-containing protein [Anaerolineae bacterium]
MSIFDEKRPEGILQPVVQSLQNGLGNNLVALALFGSRARGDATPESDWDLLLIAHHLPERTLPRLFHLKSLLPEDWRAQISLLAKTPQEFEGRLPSLYLDIALDAIVLYDPQGYLQERLGRLREQIARWGLIRERSNGDWTWRWKEMPPARWALEWEVIR